MAKCEACQAEVEKVCDKCSKCDGHCKCGEETAADAGEAASGEEASTEAESTSEKASEDKSEEKTD